MMILASRMPVSVRSSAVPGVALLLALASVSAAQDAAQLDRMEQEAFRAAVARVAPSVVRIETIGGAERVGDGLIGTGPTTGLVVAADGTIVSSAYNFAGAPASILVRLPDGSRKPARLVATDHHRMLVLLKIEPDAPLAVPEVVPEAEMRVGQWALALGRALESEQPSIAVGILSATNRIWGKAIQTDAAVSPNNYGGPLVDIRGRVLGVLVPLSPEEAEAASGAEWYDSGIGFAVPAWHVMEILPRLQSGESLRPGVLGVSLASPNLYTDQPVIGACHPNAPARKAGLKKGDRIVEIDGRPVAWGSQLKEAIGRHYAGDTIRIAVVRGEERIERDVELLSQLEPFAHGFLGILPLRRTADAQPTGVAVRWVYPDSPAAKAGIAAGDLVTGVAGSEVKNRQSLAQAMVEMQPGEGLELQLRRGETVRTAQVELAAQPETVPDDLPPAAPAPAEKPAAAPAVGWVSLKAPEFENEAAALVPADYQPAVPHALVVYLGRPGVLDKDVLASQWEDLCQKHDLILLAPKSASNERWRPREAALVRRLVDLVGSGYSIDPERVVVIGQDDGAALASVVTLRERELVRGLALVEGELAALPQANDPIERLDFLLATADGSSAARAVNEAATQLRARKFPVVQLSLGPKPRPLSADDLTAIARWIDSLDRL